MKKLIIFCFVLLFAACKDKEVVEEEKDYAPDFIGNYSTQTATSTYSTTETWVVTRQDKDILAIEYKIVHNQTIPINKTETLIYSLKNVTITDESTLVINESADWSYNGTKLRAKVEGTGKKGVYNGSPGVGITFKITDLANNSVTEREYLVFKKN